MVGEGAAADFGRVMREYATGGYDLILGDAFAAERESRRTARSSRRWRSCSAPAPAGRANFGVFDNWIHEPAYLSGLIAGKMSKSNIVGAVAAMGIPEVNRLVNAFCHWAPSSPTPTSRGRSPSSARSSIRPRPR